MMKDNIPAVALELRHSLQAALTASAYMLQRKSKH